MAKVNNNIFVRGLSGSLGDQFVIRKGRGGETIVSNMPSSSEGPPIQPGPTGPPGNVQTCYPVRKNC